LSRDNGRLDAAKGKSGDRFAAAREDVVLAAPLLPEIATTALIRSRSDCGW
jgi:hypothetical protein